jgi:hypothetical protein
MISFGFSARHWQQIEAGRPIPLTTLLRIGEAFRVPADRLLSAGASHLHNWRDCWIRTETCQAIPQTDKRLTQEM